MTDSATPRLARHDATPGPERRAVPFATALRLVAVKDLRREWRSREAIQAAIVLVLLFLLIDLFAWHSLANEPRAAAVALWTPVVFATAALCGRGLAAEADLGTLALMQALPVPRLALGLARTLVNVVVALGAAGLTLLAAHLGFQVAVDGATMLAMGLSATTLAVLGTLAAGLAVRARGRDILLPVLLVPVAAPVLQAGIRATIGSLSGAGWSELQSPILLLVADLILACGAATILWEFLLED